MDENRAGLAARETLQDRLAKRRRLRQKKISQSNSLNNTPTTTQSLDRLSAQKRIESSGLSIEARSMHRDLTPLSHETSLFSEPSINSLPNPDSFQSSPSYPTREKSFQLDEKSLILPPIPAPRRRHLPPRSPRDSILARTTSEQVISKHRPLSLTRHNSSALAYLFHRRMIEGEMSSKRTSWD